jgi:hypothetical protein
VWTCGQGWSAALRSRTTGAQDESPCRAIHKQGRYRLQNQRQRQRQRHRQRQRRTGRIACATMTTPTATAHRQDCLCYEAYCNDANCNDANGNDAYCNDVNCYDAARCGFGFETGLRKIMDCMDSLDWTLAIDAGKVNMPIISLTR